MSTQSHNDVINNLQALGFSTHEAHIYLSVLKHGEASAGVVLDEVQLHREQVYRALKRLVDEGFITQYEKRKRSYYSATDPVILVNRTKAKVAIAESTIPFLEKLHQQKPQIIKVTEGIDATKLQFEDVYNTLCEGEEYLVLGGIGKSFYEHIQSFIPKFQGKFSKKQITGRVLMYKGSEFPKGAPFSERLSLRKIERPADTPASTVIYGNKIGIDLIDNDTISVITIENKNIADSFRKTFEALWKIQL